MIIDDLDTVGTRFLPDEANPPSIVDSDTVLSLPITFQNFQVVSPGRRKIGKLRREMNLQQLSEGYPLDCPKALDALSLKKTLRVAVRKRLDHPPTITCVPCNE
jgi:hypothetical protein